MARITFADIAPEEAPLLVAIARDHGVLRGAYDPVKCRFVMQSRHAQILDVAHRLYLTFIPYPAVA